MPPWGSSVQRQHQYFNQSSVRAHSTGAMNHDTVSALPVGQYVYEQAAVEIQQCNTAVYDSRIKRKMGGGGWPIVHKHNHNASYIEGLLHQEGRASK